MPLALAALFTLQADDGAWSHVVWTLGPSHGARTLALMATAALIALILGGTTAWVLAAYRFPGCAAFGWLLLLPLAMPPYVAAFVWSELFDSAGTGRLAMQAVGLGWAAPNPRTLLGAAFVLGSTLSPYVFIPARIAFARQGMRAMEAARALDRNPIHAFFAAALPMAWPALATGAALVALEAANDIGVTTQLGVPTLSIAIHDAWLERHNLAAGLRLATALALIAAMITLLERMARRSRRFHPVGGNPPGHYAGVSLSGARAWLAFATCLTPFVLGFLAPALPLLAPAVRTAGYAWRHGLLSATLTAIGLGLLAVTLISLLAFASVAATRLAPTRARAVALRFAGAGYAIPGAALAIALFIPLVWFDNALDAFTRDVFGFGVGMALTGSLAGLTLAYCARFMAAPQTALEAAQAQMPPSLDEAAQVSGATPLEVVRRVYWPTLAPALAGGALIAFMDIVKELPMTLFLRPFGVNTLAVEAHTRMTLGLAERAAPYALTLTLICVPAAIWARRLLSTSRERK